jgi:tetratricopeptide (TPR) repeat protein
MFLNFTITRGKEPSGKFTPGDSRVFRESEKSADLVADGFALGAIGFDEAVLASMRLLEENPLNLKALSFLMDLRLRAAPSHFILREDFLGRFGPYLSLIGSYEGALDPNDASTCVFLSCHYTLILSLIQSERYEEALKGALRHSAWDPPGALEVDSFVGNLLILIKEYEEAERFLSSPPIPTPSESL